MSTLILNENICSQPFARAFMRYAIDRKSIAVNYGRVLNAFVCASKM